MIFANQVNRGSQSMIVPNILGRTPELVEALFTLLYRALVQTITALDLALVDWINPYGAVSLLGICCYLKQCTGKPICLMRLQHHIHAYLRRIGFFTYDPETVYTIDPFDPSHEWSRNSSSCNVLEIFSICKDEDIYAVADKARQIFTYWLDRTNHTIDTLVELLSEACSNIVDHSGESGMITIQKYEYRDCIDVHLAISDLGKGIRRSLLAVHGEVSDTCAGYIEKALDGLSARPGERGGQGLGAIQRIVTVNGGSLYLRSETGSVTVGPLGTTARDSLCCFPGTQMAVTFRSR